MINDRERWLIVTNSSYLVTTNADYKEFESILFVRNRVNLIRSKCIQILPNFKYTAKWFERKSGLRFKTSIGHIVFGTIKIQMT